MAKYIAAENAEIWLVPAVSDVSAMTVVEGDAGTRLTGFIQGGFAADFAGNVVDSATLISAFNSTVAGTYGGGTSTISGILKDNSADTAWDALPRGTAGYFVVSNASHSQTQSGAAWTTGDIYDIFPCEVVSRGNPDYTRDALVTFDVEYSITSEPTYGGTAA